MDSVARNEELSVRDVAYNVDVLIAGSGHEKQLDVRWRPALEEGRRPERRVGELGLVVEIVCPMIRRERHNVPHSPKLVQLEAGT